VVSSKAPTPDAYVAELPPERAGLVQHLRELVNAVIPPGYEERMSWGMMAWEVPLSRFANTHNGQPLVFAGLAAQKNFTALYLNCVHASEERTERFRRSWAATGRKLDMGKSCLRFKRREDVAEEVIAEALAAVPVDRLISDYQAGRVR
jgi:hypothetical protein